jgi:predicted RNA-binding protein with TRAM domain
MTNTKELAVRLLKGEGPLSLAQDEGIDENDAYALEQKLERTLTRWKGNSNYSPVEEGEELTLEITDIGRKGDGVAFKDGLAIFCQTPDGEDGPSLEDVVSVKVTSVKENCAFAIVENINTNNEDGAGGS